MEVKLVGGPDDGAVTEAVGAHLLAQPAVFGNGYVCYTGTYLYEQQPKEDGTGMEMIGKFYPAILVTTENYKALKDAGLVK